MNVLAIETATPCHSVALLRGHEVAACVERHADGSHAKWIIPTVDAVLKTAGLALRDVGGIAVSIGPGSFTGLRIGLATALGLRAVSKLPLVAVPTLEALAWNVRQEGRDVCPILKARAGEAYWALYRWTPEGRLIQVQEARVGPVELIPASLTRTTVVLGDGWLAYEARLRTLLAAGPGRIRPASAERLLPSAVSVGRAALERLEQGEVEPGGLSPRYVQRSEAELNWEQARSGPRRDGRVRKGVGATPSPARQ